MSPRVIAIVLVILCSPVLIILALRAADSGGPDDVPVASLEAEPESGRKAVRRDNLDEDLEAVETVSEEEPSGELGAVRGRIVDESNRPLAEIQVQLRRRDPENGGVVSEASTGGAGLFELAALGGASFDLFVFSSGSFSLAQESVRVGDFVTHVLSTGWVIRGRVVDAATGQGIQQAEVSATQGLRRSSPVRTDEEGSFRVSDLGAGNLTIRVAAQGYAPETVTRIARDSAGADDVLIELVASQAHLSGVVLADGRTPVRDADVYFFGVHLGSYASDMRKAHRPFAVTTDESGWFEVEQCSAGENGTLVVEAEGLGRYFEVLRPVPATPIEVVLTPSVAVEGLVVGGDDGPIEGASVSTFYSRFRDKSTVTDAAGRFRFEGYAGGEKLRIEVDAGSEGRAKIARHVVDRDPEQELVIRILRNAVVDGFVSDGQSAVSDCRVDLVGREPRLLREHRQTFTDESGLFSFQDLEPGQYEVFFESGHFARDRRDLTLSEDERAKLHVELAPGVEVSGRVIDDMGSGLAAASIVVRSRERMPPGGKVEARTDSSGSFSLGGFLEGERVEIEIAKRGFRPREVDWLGGESKEVVLQPCFDIGGRVYLEDGSGPVESFQIHLERSGNGAPLIRGFRHSEGEFLLPCLGPGEYRVKASVEGLGESDPLLVTLGDRSSSSDPERLELSLEVGGILCRIRARGTDGELQPWGGLPVTLQRVGDPDDERFWALTDAEGEIWYPRAPVGTWRAWVGDASTPAAETSFRFEGATVNHETLDVLVTRSLTVTVLDSSGKKLPGVTVAAGYLGSGLASVTGETDSEGSCVLNGLVPGTCRVGVRYSSDVRELREVTIPSGADAEIEIRLTK